MQALSDLGWAGQALVLPTSPDAAGLGAVLGAGPGTGLVPAAPPADSPIATCSHQSLCSEGGSDD